MRFGPIDDGLDVPDFVIPKRGRAQRVDRRFAMLAEIKADDIPSFALGDPVIAAKIPTAAMKAMAHENGPFSATWRAQDRTCDLGGGNAVRQDAKRFAPQISGRRRLGAGGGARDQTWKENDDQC